MKETTLLRVERVCAELATSGQPITFTAVAEHAQISRATLYRDHQLRAIVDEHRTRQIEPRTLRRVLRRRFGGVRLRWQGRSGRATR
jgi:hypothetical protein